MCGRVARGEVSAVRRWLNEGNAVDSDVGLGMTPLIVASMEGEEELVKLLLERGADINMQSDLGITALMSATNKGQTAVVKLLLAAGAAVATRDDAGRSAMDRALDRPNTDIVDMLFKALVADEPRRQAEEKATDQAVKKALSGLKPYSFLDAMKAKNPDDGLPPGSARDLPGSTDDPVQRDADRRVCEAVVAFMDDVESYGEICGKIHEYKEKLSTLLMASREASRVGDTSNAKLMQAMAEELVALDLVRRVRVVGLQARPELNGRRGIRCGKPTHTCKYPAGRWPISVGGERVLIKLENLRPDPDDSEDEDGPDAHAEAMEAINAHAHLLHVEVPKKADPPAFAPGARVRISGLKSKPELDGVEASVLGWHADKERFAVRPVRAAGSSLLIRRANLERSACPFDRLDDDLLILILQRLPTWQDAARAAAVQRAWRLALTLDAWPARAQAPTPSHWRELTRFGSDWEEKMPFARPHRWAWPTDRPSWLQALHGMRGSERAPEVLRWLDAMERRYPGVLITRWPGAAERLRWLRGAAPDGMCMHDLRGDILREFAGSLKFNTYRDGGTFEDTMEDAPPCPFRPPADAALFFALCPGGFGEEASDGSFVRTHCGFEITLEPWPVDRGIYSFIRGADAATMGCSPDLLMPVGVWQTDHPDDDPDLSDEENDDTKFYYLFVCCDESRPGVYGKIVSVVREIEDGRDMKSVALHDVTFAKLLRMILAAAKEASGYPGCQSDLARTTNDSRARCDGAGHWDLTWDRAHRAAQRLVDDLGSRRFRVPCNQPAADSSMQTVPESSDWPYDDRPKSDDRPRRSGRVVELPVHL